MRGRAGAMPELVPPMQVSAGTGQPPTGPDWVVELAWTGHRCIAYVQPGRRVRLLSSGAVSMTAAYPELVAELVARSHPGGMVLDGTLVARGEEHAPRAAKLQRRSARHRPSEGHIARVPVDFQVADLLWLDGHATVDLAYRDRRALLEQLGFDAAPVWATSPIPVTELSSMLRLAEAKGVDALHARHLGSRYRPGQRSPLWVRVPVPRTGRVVVGGWTPVDAARPDRVASLLVGVPGPGGGVQYVGRVGVAGEERRRVAGLRELQRDTSPFAADLPRDAARHAIWVDPRVHGLVEFTGFTADGRLRLPHWRGAAGAGAGGVRWARRNPGEDGGDATPAVGGPAAGDRAGRLTETDPDPDRVAPGGSGGAGSGGAGSGGARLGGARSGGDGAGGDGAATPGQGSDAPISAGSGTAGAGVAEPAGAGWAGAAVAGAGPVTPAPTGAEAVTAEPVGAGPAPTPADPAGSDPGAVEHRRLEQHFVYNSLNTIASLIRTDPSRARELLVGFSDLTRAAERADPTTSLGRELETVGRYLALEQARFGRRLRVEIAVDAALRDVKVAPMALLGPVRDAVQRDIEPRPQGGVLSVSAAGDAGGCVVTVVGGAGDAVHVTLPAP